MYTCDHFRSLLWEDQFGLLEAEQSEGLRQHLAACSTCQAEQFQAEVDYRLLAQAARLDIEIPPFKAPEADPGPVLLKGELEPLLETRRRSWHWLAAAAAVLLLIGASYGIYSKGLTRREAAFLTAETSVKEIIAEREQARGKAEKEAHSLVAQYQAKHLRVQVLGPAAYQPANQNQYRVLTTNLAGAPVDVQATARVIEPTGRIVGEARKTGGTGELLLTLQPRAPVQSLKTAWLEIEAQGLDEEVKLRTQLPILEASYLTHLKLDKQVYRPGERVYFRSVTLEGFEPKPPDQAFQVIYTLKGPGAASLASLSGPTRPKDGIGNGVFDLPKNCPEGEYTLTVTEAENRFSPVKRQLQVRRSLPRHPVRPAAASNELFVDFFPEGGDLVGDLPQRVYFRVRDGRGQPVELAGSLVDSTGKEIASLRTAGMDGQPALSRGLGVFTFPDKKRTSGWVPLGPLKLRITSPAGIAAAADLPVNGFFRRPRGSVRTKTTQGTQPLDVVLQELSTNGVGLSIPVAVTSVDEPLAVIVPGGGEPMVVGVFCRGRLVAAQAVSVNRGQAEARLTMPTNAQGILRVTLFVVYRDHLLPVAERLVYRRPAKRLSLSLAAEKERYSPGEQVRLLIQTPEKQSSEITWLQVSVVNRDALGRVSFAEPGLPAYFYLGAELDPAVELEDADLLVSDDPRAVQALDLFLGTYGWRRFVAPDPKEVLVQNQAGADVPGALDGVLRLDNLDDVERKNSAEVRKALASLQATLAARSGELTAEGERSRDEALRAAEDLDGFRARAALYARIGLGSGRVATLTTGCILLSLAAVRLVRRRTANRRYLVGAFTALFLCLITYAAQPQPLDRGDQLTEIRRAELLGPPLKDVAKDRQVLAEVDMEAPVIRQRPLAGSRGEKLHVEQASALAYQPGDGIAKPHQSSVAQIEKGQPADFSRSGAGPLIAFGTAGTQGPAPRPLPVREYAYDRTKLLANSPPAAPDTILWKPVLPTADGKVQVQFDLPKKPATYRIRVEGHTSSGRLGAVERTLEVRPNAAK